LLRQLTIALPNIAERLQSAKARKTLDFSPKNSVQPLGYCQLPSIRRLLAQHPDLSF